MATTIESFKSALTGGGARSNLWQVTFEGFNENELLLVKTAALPATNLNPVSVNFRGRTINLPGDQAPPADWTMTVINDENFKFRDYFEKWISRMSNYTTWQGSNNAEKQDATVTQLSRQGTPLKTYKFMGLFPVSISEIGLNHDAGAIEEFTVTFKVDLFQPENII